jgi:hypothetical protein
MHDKEQPIVGTVGLRIRADVGFDISGATKYELHYHKPDGTYGVFVGAYELYSDPVDGEDKHTVAYTTLSANDIDQAGRWTFQAYVEMGSNKFWGTPDKTERFIEKLS